MDLIKIFTFDSAHRLPCVADGHKCSNVHGHTFKVEIHLTGQVDKEQAWVIDFADIKRAFGPTLDELDHHYLNEIEGLNNSTSENLARWTWSRVKLELPLLTKIIVSETCHSGCVYRGGDEEVFTVPDSRT